MKHIHHIIILLLTLLPLAGCRSNKNSVATLQQEEATWSNVQMPVTLSMVKPTKMSISGTATLVRGEYVYVSLRFLGFEVGQINVTPEVADVVLKQPQKLWMQTPVARRLEQLDIPFTSLQEILMGNRDFMSKVPSNLKVEFAGTDAKPEVTVSGKFNDKELQLTLTWNLSSAKWNLDSPKTFSEPGSNFQKITLEEALKKFAVIK